VENSAVGRICFLGLFWLLASSSIFGQSLNEILAKPTDKSITLTILFESKNEVYIEYGASPSSFNKNTIPVIAPVDTPWELVIGNLQPDTRYYYKVRYRAPGGGSYISGNTHTFHTQRALASPFKFIIDADQHLFDKKGSAALYKIALKNEANDTGDFLINMGDLFGDDRTPTSTTADELKLLHKNMRPYLGAICHSSPLFICLGDHEGENAFYLAQTPPNNLGVNATLARKFYYTNPVNDLFYKGNNRKEGYGIGYPENYYAWEWGNALFIVLDVYRHTAVKNKAAGWDWSLGDIQYYWFKNVLEKSKARFKFVFAHHVMGDAAGAKQKAKFFEWGGYEMNGTTYSFNSNRSSWTLPIHKLMVANNVSAFFQGHDHLFAHEQVDDIVYQTVPMVADSTYKLGIVTNGSAFRGDTVRGSGHLRVSVDTACIQVDFIRAYLAADEKGGKKNGELGFTYTFCPIKKVSIDTTKKDTTQTDTTKKDTTHVGFHPLDIQGDEPILYPNPATQTLNVLVPAGQLLLNVSVYNANGQVLMHSQERVINLQQVSEGIYYIIIDTDRCSLRRRVLVRR
jgi:hypothetical protein